MLYITGCYMFYVEQFWTCTLQPCQDTLWKTCPGHSQKVGEILTLWKPSQNVLQTLCLSWDHFSPDVLGNSGQKKGACLTMIQLFWLSGWRACFHRCVLRWVLAFSYISELPVIEDIKHSRESLVWKLRWCSWVCGFQQKNIIKCPFWKTKVHEIIIRSSLPTTIFGESVVNTFENFINLQ